jgi:hypothetical protein
MEHNGPANIVTLCRDIREGRRPFSPDALDAIESNTKRTIAYMDAWQNNQGFPGTTWRFENDRNSVLDTHLFRERRNGILSNEGF